MTLNQAYGATSQISPGTGPVLDGRYRLTRRVGRGGMADVWAAEDLLLHRPVAVKVFRFDAPGADDERIDAEMRTIAGLSHPGIVTVHDAGTADEPNTADTVRTPYLVMELVDGRSLAERLARGALAPSDVTELATQLADTLCYMHGRGVVHRDVKPANILLQTPEGTDAPARFRARLTDFGVARLVDSARITEVGMTIGTANYLSPEQITGATVGPPADIYSLGLVLLESLTGEVVYPGTGVEAAMARLARPPQIPDKLGERWPSLLSAMTATEPGDRPSAADLSVALDRRPARRAPAVSSAGRSGQDVATSARSVRRGSVAGASLDTRPLAMIGGRRAPAAHRRRWWLAIGTLIATALLVVLVAGVSSGGSTGTGVPERSGSPTYPTVPGRVGQHLQKLEDAVG